MGAILLGNDETGTSTVPSCGSCAKCRKHLAPEELSEPKLGTALGAEKTMTATDVTGFDAIFSTGFFATFSRF